MRNPVITLSTPWADNSQGEVIGNCVGGFVASKKSQLKRLIEELLFDEQLQNDMGRAGRERTINLYDYRNVSESHLTLLIHSNSIFF